MEATATESRIIRFEEVPNILAQGDTIGLVLNFPSLFDLAKDDRILKSGLELTLDFVIRRGDLIPSGVFRQGKNIELNRGLVKGLHIVDSLYTPASLLVLRNKDGYTIKVGSRYPYLSGVQCLEDDTTLFNVDPNIAGIRMIRSERYQNCYTINPFKRDEIPDLSIYSVDTTRIPESYLKDRVRPITSGGRGADELVIVSSGINGQRLFDLYIGYTPEGTLPLKREL